MTASIPLGARVLSATPLAVLLVALPLPAFAQNTGQLGNLPNQTRLQRALGTAISNPGTGPGDPARGICPKMMDLGFTRSDTTPAGDLFRACGDLVNSAVAVSGGTPAGGIDLDVSAAELNAALDSIAHMQMPAIGKSASEVAVIQAAAVGQRLYALREGAEGVSYAANFVDADGRPVIADSGWLDAGAAGSHGEMADGALGGFVNLRGGFGDRDGNDEELGFDFYDAGLTFGADYRFSDVFVAGLAAGYTFADRDFSRSGGDLETHTGSGWAYFGLSEAGFFLDGLYGYSFHAIDSERNVLIPAGTPSGGATGAIRSADGETEADEHTLAASGGYLYETGGLGIGPVARIEYIRLEVDDFRESGAGGLSLAYEDDEIDSLILNVGGEVSYDVSTGFGVLTPQVRVEWAHQFEDDSRVITARYRFDPTQTKFFVRTRTPDRDYIDFAASLAAQLGGGFSAFVNYETLFAHDDLNAHTFTLGGRIQF